MKTDLHFILSTELSNTIIRQVTFLSSLMIVNNIKLLFRYIAMRLGHKLIFMFPVVYTITVVFSLKFI